MPSVPERREALRRLLEATGRAHHGAFAGPDPDWARWYAASMYEALLPLLTSNPTVEDVASWLARAEERYRATGSDEPWPVRYAEWFLAWDAAPGD